MARLYYLVGVSHMRVLGVAVESGHRVVFVASFSCAATYGVVKMDEQRDIYGDSL